MAIVEVVLLDGSFGAAFVRDMESLDMIISHSVGSSEHINDHGYLTMKN